MGTVGDPFDSSGQADFFVEVTLYKRGDFVEFDGLLGVVVGTFEDGMAPEDHVALWLGAPQGARRSEVGVGGLTPEVWAVPAEDCKPAPSPVVHH